MLFAAVHMQYQNLLTLAEMFLVGADYISCPDQKWRPAAAGIAAYGSYRAGFTVGLKVIFLLNIVR
nr:hypothetical protein [Klebsiella pneumoniae]